MIFIVCQVILLNNLVVALGNKRIQTKTQKKKPKLIRLIGQCTIWKGINFHRKQI
jgi:hypothetical protein